MLTPSEINMTLETSQGMLRTSINRLANGQYQVDATYFDQDGYYIAHKSTTRIVDNVDDLIRDYALDANVNHGKIGAWKRKREISGRLFNSFHLAHNFGQWWALW